MRAQRSIRELVDITSSDVDETYSAADDTMDGDPATLTKVPAIFTAYEEKDIDGDVVQPLDERCVIELRYLNGVELKVSDYVTRTGAKAGRWEVINTKKPAGSAIVILQVRS